ncbi:peptidoglycan DD-metalloendopeptidase family protein [bacterium]|nr:peptidoglycan DD-metalloendopeptidase family protein [bacterium]
MTKEKKQKTSKIKSERWQLVTDFGDYLNFWHRYLRNRIYQPFSVFEKGKDVVVGGLYKDRGRKSRPMIHVGVVLTAFFVVVVAPSIFEQTAENSDTISTNVLAASDEVSFYTMQAEEVRQLRGGEVTKHVVKEGETLESIAQQYGLQKETIMWENSLKEKAELKEGQELRILPVDGIRHRVAKGETIATIGKKYGLEGAAVQAIVDFPFNDFVNDETFELATGQYLMIPGGQKPKEAAAPTATFARVLTPDAGTVSATGDFIWPAAGMITQGYSFYHKAIDIASGGGGPILAADSGVVTASGWDSSGYGNRVIVDHGNGSRTLYAHMRVLNVTEGQSVNRGDVLGEMGSTGRSTGTHLHFEVRQDSVLLNPMDYLK